MRNAKIIVVLVLLRFLFIEHLAAQTSQTDAGLAVDGSAYQQGGGPPGGFVSAIAIDPLNSSTLYAGTPGGVYKSTDNGQRWTGVSAGLANLSIRTLAIDPIYPNTLYAGTAGAGVFKSANGGTTWAAVNNGIPIECPVGVQCIGNSATFLGVSALVIDPTDPAIVYAAIDSKGLFKSTDAGANWTAANNGLPISSSYPFISALAIDPINPATLYAGARGLRPELSGLYKSIDGGTNWTPYQIGQSANSYVSISALAIDPINPAIVYTAVVGSPASGLFKTTNGGITWNPIGPLRGPINLLTIDPSNTATLYAGVNVVLKSTDGGNTWLSTGSTNSVFALAIDPASSATIYAGGRTGASKSTDGGASWTEVSNGITNSSASALAIDPSSSATLYAAGNSIFKSVNAGLSWSKINSGLPDSVSALVIDPSTPAVIYAGVGAAGPGDGVYKSRDGGTTWMGVWNGGAGRGIRTLVIAPTNPSLLFAVTGRSFVRSTDAGVTWAGVNFALNYPSLPTTVVFDPANFATLYAGTAAGIFKSTDAGDSWTAVNDGLTLTNSSGLPFVPAFRTLAIDPVNPAILYAAVAVSGLVFKSSNGGESWSLATNGLPGTWVEHLAVDPVNPATVYAATAVGVFKSTNGGESWNAANSGLRGGVRALVISSSSASSSTVVYAVTYNAGVFKSTDGGANWQPTGANQD